MAQFRVVEEYTEFVTKTYIVEADSEDEAVEMVRSGDVGEDDVNVEGECSEFSVEEL